MKKLIFVCAGLLALTVISCSKMPLATVNVSGSGIVTFLPDTVNFSVTVKNVKPTLNEAVSLTSGAVKEILAVCTQFGISTDDVKTSYVNTGKKYDRKDYNEPEVFVGYTADQTIQVNYRDLPQFEKFSAALLALDITALNNVQFTHSQFSKYAAEANLIALDDAKKSAEKMAERMSVKLGRVLFMANSPEAIPFSNAYAKDEMVVRRYSGSAGMEVSPGILSVTGTVQVVFEIK